MSQNRNARPLPPLRVRHEPPTIQEAVAAAEGWTSDLRQQAEFAAGLMGVTVEEVEPYLRSSPAPRPQRHADPERLAGPRGAVVVERKVRRGLRSR